MRTRLTILLAVFTLAGAAAAGPEKSPVASAGEGDVALEYKAARTWTYDLPAERFRPVSGAFDFTPAGGPRFVAKPVGQALAIDTDGDGEADVKVEGQSGFVHLRTQGERPFHYAVRLVHGAGGWQYAAGGARVGRIGTTRITLIDQDGDGRYDGFGRDAMIVGRSKTACFLSRAVNIDGELRRIVVNQDGTRLGHRPHEGETGTLDLASQWEAKAKLQGAIVRSTDGRWSFDLSRAVGGLKVPAGTYELHSGKLGLGENVVRFTRGRAKPFEVTKDGTTVVRGGGPLEAEFAYRRSGGEVTFDPGTVRYYGRAGEVYVGWKPFGKSPVFTVADAGTKQEIASAIFTGC